MHYYIRAGTTGCACLVHYANLDVSTAIRAAKKLRPIIDPIGQLPEFLNRLYKAERSLSVASSSSSSTSTSAAAAAAASSSEYTYTDRDRDEEPPPPSASRLRAFLDAQRESAKKKEKDNGGDE